MLASALYARKVVRPIVSASHLVQYRSATEETRIYLMRDHKIYVEKVTQDSTSSPACSMSVAVLPQAAFDKIEQLVNSPDFTANWSDEKVEPASEEQDVWHIVLRNGSMRFLVFQAPQSFPPSEFVSWFDSAGYLPNRAVEPSDYKCEFFSEEIAKAWRQ